VFLNSVRASRPEKFKPATLTAQFAADNQHLKGSVAALFLAAFLVAPQATQRCKKMHY
jgi:hypothetical protein